MSEEQATFRAAFPPILSAIRCPGDGGMRIMLDIPESLYTPIFAVARVPGWCAHRAEAVISDGKIIRPAYKNVQSRRSYIPLYERG